MMARMSPIFPCTRADTIEIIRRVRCLTDESCIWSGHDPQSGTRSNRCAWCASILATRLAFTTAGSDSTRRCCTIRRLWDFCVFFMAWRRWAQMTIFQGMIFNHITTFNQTEPTNSKTSVDRSFKIYVRRLVLCNKKK